MEYTAFARTWFLDPKKPALGRYPSLLDDDEKPPALESSLEDIGEYQRRLWANGRKALLLVIHGPDTSGKDSLIRTLATYADPAGFHAWSFSRPTATESAHDFLWRVTPLLPAYGQMVAFNRSHHEAVIAERVWPVRAEESYNWQARYRAIRDFEQHLVSEGTCVVKVWLNLSEDEHKRRLLKRLDKPRKRWKFDRSDIEGWKMRDKYQAYAEEALAATHTNEAPWFIVPGDRKPEARAIVAALVAEVLKSLAPDYPEEHPDVLEEYRTLLAENGVE
ncbi:MULTISPECIES: polyphosphate kinase 2 family protein [Marinobacter]|jgi:PPK2 family polyphosphate:nucleotide phosphotransferase|uniref:PPK2 family polyphosphate kinase n=1 Tax=Marinobacter alkaliphilus TaxID=254719 RepID=A0ABZ3E3Y2_9GAMM|nr:MULTISPECIES: PPK2 family polyphosphate kinase [unclassified Marinobacter]QFS88755.1 Polyphosphate kinase 2 (PPK2) [Marinobacter sp. THAF197a]QFT52540.1 Polyphosphate kinase 2 (PPK2) [Marinobacter sp. THAF39]